MRRWLMGGCLAAAMTTFGVVALQAAGPGECSHNIKGIGAYELSIEDRPDTWWGLTKAGLDFLGIDTPAEQQAQIGVWFGTTFGSLTAAVTALVDAVRILDKNENGWVCASTVRGTRTAIGDPDFEFTSWHVIDDKRVD